jgi:DnaJ-class molecular chaperone
VFTREDSDLIMEKKILLSEALCGVKFTVEHLDGRILLVKSKEGEIIRPGDSKSIDGEGMPSHRNPTQKGKLIIKFQVEFPADFSLTPKAVNRLRKILPKPATEEIPMDTEEVTMDKHVEQYSNGTHRREAYDNSDSDDDEDHHAGVSCNQQ